VIVCFFIGGMTRKLDVEDGRPVGGCAALSNGEYAGVGAIGMRVLMLIGVIVIGSGGGGDSTAVEMVSEWRARDWERVVTSVDGADIVVAATVVRAEGCRAARLEVGKLACGTLRPIQVLRGDLGDGDFEVQYFDYRDGLGISGMARMPVGPDGSAGVYYLQRRGGRIWARVKDDRSYVSVSAARYVRRELGQTVRESVAVNLLRAGAWGLAEDIDGVIRVSEAIGLTDLFRVSEELQRMSLAGDPAVAAGGCVILTVQFGRLVDCADRLRRAGGLSPELLGALGRAEVEGDIHLESIGKTLRGTGPVIVQGLLNSAPGGGCEFVRFQLQHRLGWVRELAKARVRGACG
jgi:hypothetical protein